MYVSRLKTQTYPDHRSSESFVSRRHPRKMGPRDLDSLKTCAGLVFCACHGWRWISEIQLWKSSCSLDCLDWVFKSFSAMSWKPRPKIWGIACGAGVVTVSLVIRSPSSVSTANIILKQYPQTVYWYHQIYQITHETKSQPSTINYHLYLHTYILTQVNIIDQWWKKSRLMVEKIVIIKPPIQKNQKHIIN